ncbi:MAG: capsule biosynthesis protein CapA [Pseudomonadota bacterium]
MITDIGWGTTMSDTRTFLMLQGPHGPFFRSLATQLRAAGHKVLRIGFNYGDRFFWGMKDYVAFTGDPKDWPEFLENLLAEMGVTDVVLYGDTRLLHQQAIDITRTRQVELHIFEEGYLRPFWISYERDGVNGYSPLSNISIEEMRDALSRLDKDVSEVPASWGELREHVFYGAVYHGLVMARPGEYKNFRSHRRRTIRAELRSHLKHMLQRPFKAVRRSLAELQIKRGGYIYSLVLLQLAHDASIQHHSSFKDMISLIRLCLQDFANGAPKHHHLVFKAHPLEDYFQPLYEYAFARAEQLGIRDRVHFVEGGRLADLLDSAHSVVTVNSTAGQQALWRGLPLRSLGRSVYNKESLVSSQPLAEFFADPKYPNKEDYLLFRRFMLETSQVFGGFYSSKGRINILRNVLPRMLRKECPYTAVLVEPAERQDIPKLRLVK